MYATGIETDTSIYEFPDPQTGARWNQQVLGIKDQIASINGEHPDRDGYNRRRLRNIYRVWLKAVANLASVFGNDFVPKDIRRACNDVETACGHQPTQW